MLNYILRHVLSLNLKDEDINVVLEVKTTADERYNIIEQIKDPVVLRLEVDNLLECRYSCEVNIILLIQNCFTPYLTNFHLLQSEVLHIKILLFMNLRSCQYLTIQIIHYLNIYLFQIIYQMKNVKST